MWSRVFATGLGHETPSMLAIVCAFMFGMALGAWMLDKRIDRSPRPGRWYAVLELTIGVWAFASAALIPTVNEVTLKLIGVDPSPLRHWLVVFALPALALLPATAAMGAAFPAMERFVASFHAGPSVARVYAANTFGAVAGILISTFVIAPRLGFTITLGALGTLNILCGIVAFLITRRSSRSEETHHTPVPSDVLATGRLLATTIFTGLLGIGYEIAATRVLSQVLENTIYTFAAVLSIYLLGTATGAALYQRFGATRDSRAALSSLVCGTALACMLGVFTLSRAPTLYHFARQLGDASGAVLVAEMFVAAAVFLLPTMLMGATFSHVVQRLRSAGCGVGRTAALNTLAGAFATVIFGIVLLPVLGSKWTLVCGSLAYAALAPAISRVNAFMLAVAALIAFALPTNLHIVSVTPGGKVIAFKEGVMAAVAVVEDARGDRVLRVNNRFQMGGTAAADAECRQAHIPLLLHPQPRRALFLGIGTGITLGGAALHTNLVVDGVELVPEVVEVMPLFEPHNRSPQHRTNFTLHVTDARRFVRTTTNLYDVIVADLFHPARDGAGSLYTVEHFDAIRQRLAMDGLFCQWLPLHQLDETMFGIILQTFSTVFPDAQIFLLRYNVDAPVVGLVGTFSRFNYRPDWLEQRAMNVELHDELKRLALGDSLRLFGHFIGNASLLVTVDSDDLNTDDAPLVSFGAPRFVYEKDATPYRSLMTLITSLDRMENSERVAVWSTIATNEAFQNQLSAFTRARDVYLRGLVSDYEGDRAAAIKAYVASARMNAEFTSGYAQCLSIAGLLANSEPAKARAILEQLIEAQPSRPLAREMLRRLAPPSP